MKYAPACISLVLAATVIGGCATRPPAPERAHLVQLSATPSDGACDWSILQDVNEPPIQGYLSVGSAEWPRMVPALTRGWRRLRDAPLQAFGSGTGFQWSSRGRSICLPLYKRTSIWQAGVPPILTLELRPDGAETRVAGQTTNPGLAKVTILVQPSQTESDFARQRLDLSFRDGRAEGNLVSPTNGQWLRVTIVATETGGEGQTERAVELLSSGERGGSRIVREGSKLVAKPSWPGPGRRSSQPR